MKIVYNENLSQQQVEEMYQNDDACMKYLSELKWADGFTCRKCGNDNFCEGKMPHSRRCTRCKNEESATANTLFHNVKFPVSKAFYITYTVCKNTSTTISTYDLSSKLDLRQMTCWKFRNKVESKINRLVNSGSSDKINMTDILVGDYESPFN